MQYSNSTSSDLLSDTDPFHRMQALNAGSNYHQYLNASTQNMESERLDTQINRTSSTIPLPSSDIFQQSESPKEKSNPCETVNSYETSLYQGQGCKNEEESTTQSSNLDFPSSRPAESLSNTNISLSIPTNMDDYSDLWEHPIQGDIYDDLWENIWY